MKKPKTIITIIIALLVLIALIQNSGTVAVKFLWLNFSTQALIMYLIFYVLGLLSGLLLMVWRKI